MTLLRAVGARLRVEWVSRDTRVIAVMVVLAVLGRVLGTRGDGPLDAARAFTDAADPLTRFSPLVFGVLAALIAARDAEVDFVELGHSAGIDRSFAFATQFWTAAATAAAVLAAALGSAALLGVVLENDGGGFGPRNPVVASLLIPVPIWVLVGIAAGNVGRTRGRAAALFAGVLLTVLLVARLALTVPVMKWLHLVTPSGLHHVVEDGYKVGILPRRAPALLVVAGAAGWIALPLLARAWAHRRRLEPWRRRAPNPRRRVLALIAFAPLFGWAAPTPFARVIPWQYSPTWVFDQATRTTPDRTVRTFIAALRAGDGARAAEVTASGDVAWTLGLLGPAWSPPPPDASVEIDRLDEVAGTVAVRWVSGHPRLVRACTTRFQKGWRIDHFTTTNSCDPLA